MNRPIKFRVWDKNRQSLIGPVNLLGDQKYVILPENWPWEHYCEAVNLSSSAKTINEAFKEREDYARENWIIQQYTGLKDSKGNEIYEGDILERIQSPGRPRNYYQVIWHDYMWIAVCTRKNYSHCLDQFNEVKQCKIVGNIFDKPELIKNK